MVKPVREFVNKGVAVIRCKKQRIFIVLIEPGVRSVFVFRPYHPHPWIITTWFDYSYPGLDSRLTDNGFNP